MAVGENEIQTIFTANLSGLQSGLATAQKGVQGFANAAKSAITSFAPLAAVLAISAVIKQSTEAFAQFETGLNEIRKQLGAAREGELHDFEQGLKSLAVATGQALPELTSGLAKIIDLGIDAGNEMNALLVATQLQQSAGGSLESAITSLDVVTKTFGASAGTTREIAEKLFQTTLSGTIEMGELGSYMKRVGSTAVAAGVDFTQLAGAIAYMTSQQIPARIGQTFLFETMNAVSKITAEQSTVFKSHGVELDSNSIKTKGYSVVLQELAKLSAVELDAIGINVKSRGILTQMLKDQTVVAQKYTEVATAQGNIEREAARQQATTTGELRKLSEAVRVLSIDAITPLIPLLKIVVSGLAEMVRGFAEFYNSNKDVIDSVIELLGAFTPLMVLLKGGFLTLIYDIISNTLDWVKASLELNKVFSSSFLLKSLSEFGRIIQEIFPWVTKLFDSIYQAVKGFVEWQHVLRLQNDELEKNEGQVKGVAETMGVFETAQSKAAKATREATEATEAEADAIAEVTERKRGERAAIDAKVLAQKEEDRQLEAIVVKYQKLLKAYENGEITQEKFREGLAGIVEEGTKVTGSIEGITKKLEDFNKTDTTISVKVRLEADQEIKSIKERILQAQEDITLAQLDGEQRKRKEIDITLQRALRALQVELDGEIIRHNGVIALLEKERAFRADEITNRKGLLDEARRKELADLEAEIKYRLDVEKSKNLTLTDSIKQLEAIQRQTADIAVQNLDREAAGKDKVIDKTYQQIAAEEEKNRVISSAPGSTVDFGGFSPGARTTFTGGIGGLTLTTLSPFTSSIKEQVVATKNLAQSAAELKAFQAAMAPRISGFTSGVQVGPTGVLSSKYFGTPYVPKTGLYELHRGEAVIPAEQNSKQESAGITVVNLIDPAMVPQILAQYPNAVLNIVNNDILRNGQTRRVIRATR